MINYYDKDIIIQRKTVARDVYGEPDDTWRKYLTFKAFVSQVSGDKRFQSDKSGLFSTHLMKCDVLDITESDRAVISGKTYQIMNVNQPNKANFIQVDLGRAV